jgi:hypothetical protein
LKGKLTGEEESKVAGGGNGVGAAANGGGGRGGRERRRTGLLAEHVAALAAPRDGEERLLDRRCGEGQGRTARVGERAARRQPAPADELVRDWRGRGEERERGVNVRR